MRSVKLTITVMLALQLFATTGLCGRVCCAAEPDRTGHGGSAFKEHKEPATEEKIESGHCPLHAAKKAESRAQERSQSKTVQRSAVSHRMRHQTKSSSAIDAHLCGCRVKREDRAFDALLQRSFEQRPAAQNLSGSPNLARAPVGLSPSQINSSDPSRSHSPPFSGRHLHLRI
jgi:hypothetical protein